MAYTALYRKFRPQTFESVIGQEHIVRTLKNQGVCPMRICFAAQGAQGKPLRRRFLPEPSTARTPRRTASPATSVPFVRIFWQGEVST